MLGRVVFGPDQAEDHVRLLRSTGPDFLAVDDKLTAFDSCAGLQTGKVRSRAGLRIALTPDDLAFQRRLYPLALLFLGAEFQQGGDLSEAVC